MRCDLLQIRDGLATPHHAQIVSLRLGELHLNRTATSVLPVPLNLRDSVTALRARRLYCIVPGPQGQFRSLMHLSHSRANIRERNMSSPIICNTT